MSNSKFRCFILTVKICPSSVHTPISLCAVWHKTPTKQTKWTKTTLRHIFTFKVWGIMKHATAVTLSAAAREDSHCERVGVRFTLKRMTGKSHSTYTMMQACKPKGLLWINNNPRSPLTDKVTKRWDEPN